MDDDADTDKIFAIFVARFDTLRGNVIEWKYPEDANIDGAEYTTIPSGSHTLKTDIIYFSQHQGQYGVASLAVHTLPQTDSNAGDAERGARVKSVGIVSTGFAALHRHLPFLKEQAEWVDFNDLRLYFERERREHNPQVGLAESIGFQELQHEHPVSYLPDFLEYFGPAVFVLWKYVCSSAPVNSRSPFARFTHATYIKALLQRRILFYSLPPIEPVCYHVFSTLLMTSHSIPFQFEMSNNPLFCVNVADITQLSTLDSFIACTTESIFQSKESLYDLYVHHQQLIFSSASLPVPPGEQTTERRTSSRRSLQGQPRHTVNDVDKVRFASLRRYMEESDAENDGDTNQAIGSGSLSADTRASLRIIE
ncbi:hypothetical protein HK104_007231 [Borealophlyctis nickersoniae]|nr:hypothetical protein HK104_007231 [Borealophlyctis nickersoniae]